ncbi:MAG: pyruvate dehydrogenase (acetyl-transferring) E1 component subunit alpha [Acidimicrobiia bacterium]|nr:MAG: pyruvate dehydrogenase (acetyl-transferring) E1 component subunit alpha [Acidimicrobiia bacterium]
MKQDQAIQAYNTMVLIRTFEQTILELHKAGRLPGFMHVSIGQEAVPTGVSLALKPDDVITTTHRGHGDVIAKGVEIEGMMAELFAKSGGLCRAKGGSMHVTDFSKGVLGAFSIVGAGMPIALGAAMSAQRLETGSVAVCHFGDGAIAQGAAHESLNMASLWDLPVVFVRHNNLYAESTPTSEYQGFTSIEDYVGSYGIEIETVDGNDVEAVLESATRLVDRARSGGGPGFLECLTYRWYGHNIGDSGAGRPPEEVAAWKARDPIARFREKLVNRYHVDTAEIEGIESAITERVTVAVDAAEVMSEPPTEWALEDVYGDPATLASFAGVLL